MGEQVKTIIDYRIQQRNNIEIDNELRRACEKFPTFPTDVVHQAAIVGEEAGELLQAALDYYYNRTRNIDDVREELIQTAAMCLRMLAHITED